MATPTSPGARVEGAVGGVIDVLRIVEAKIRAIESKSDRVIAQLL